MTKIEKVADYFLFLSNNEEESFITPLKMQKLCYYAQAWNMVWDGKELFPEDFEAWVHGPANYTIYNRYKELRGNVIKEEIDYDILDCFTDDEKETMNVIWNDYGKYDGKYLEKLTHSEEPWQVAREGYGELEASNRIISKESMKEYYSRQYESINE